MSFFIKPRLIIGHPKNFSSKNLFLSIFGHILMSIIDIPLLKITAPLSKTGCSFFCSNKPIYWYIKISGYDIITFPSFFTTIIQKPCFKEQFKQQS